MIEDDATRQPQRRLHPAIVVLVVLLCVVAGVLIFIEAKRRAWRYTSGDAVLAILYIDDTQYSANYSESAFHEVQVGDTFDEVFDLLGEPLGHGVYPHEDEVARWKYSANIGAYVVQIDGVFAVVGGYDAERPRRMNYHQREIVFESGEVSKIICVPKIASQTWR